MLALRAFLAIGDAHAERGPFALQGPFGARAPADDLPVGAAHQLGDRLTRLAGDGADAQASKRGCEWGASGIGGRRRDTAGPRVLPGWFLPVPRRAVGID